MLVVLENGEEGIIFKKAPGSIRDLEVRRRYAFRQTFEDFGHQWLQIGITMAQLENVKQFSEEQSFL